MQSRATGELALETNDYTDRLTRQYRFNIVLGIISIDITTIKRRISFKALKFMTKNYNFIEIVYWLIVFFFFGYY